MNDSEQDTTLSSDKTLATVREIVPPITLAILFSSMAVWSWRKWPDVLIDFGHELYFPWQIVSGKVLYGDLDYLYGPFSQYFNALLFRIFGVSYVVLFVANLVLLAIFLTVLYLMLDAITSRVAAFMACAVMICVFAFAQYVFTGNYNFISPYTHGVTHGIILSLLMIHQLWKFSIDGRTYHLLVAGFAFGLVVLTKVEVALAAFAAALLFFLVLVDLDRRRLILSTRSTLTFLLSAMAPILGFATYFSTVLPREKILDTVFGPFGMLLHTEIARNPFYVRSMGLDDVIGNSVRMVSTAALALLSVVATLWLSRFFVMYKSRTLVRRLCLIGFGGIIALTLLVDPYLIGYPFPILVSVTFVLLLTSYCRVRHVDEMQSKRLVPLLLWAAFSICLLPKILLNSRLYHFGSFLAMPSALLLCIMLTWFLPQWLDSKATGGYVFRNVMLAVLALVALRCVLTTRAFYEVKSFPVGKGGDTIVTYEPRSDPRGPAIATAVEWLQCHLDTNDTFMALPEGVMLNYLARRESPSRYTNITMTEILAYGESAILDDIASHPPDYVVFFHRDMTEFGVGYFGSDPRYGQQIMNWVSEHYLPVHLIGDEPLTDDGFGIRILRRMD